MKVCDFLLPQCISRCDRADFCKTALLSVAGAFMCCCDTISINVSFQHFPCFVENEKFQLALNLTAGDVI